MTKLAIAGIDEAGRGALAGPVVTACVIFDNTCDVTLFKDSKQLTLQNRNDLYDYLMSSSSLVTISIVSVGMGEADIAQLNATLEAMKSCLLKLGRCPDKTYIDGNKAPIVAGYQIETVIKGDQLIPEVSAASVVAKVVRDRIMKKYDRLFPMYYFNQHKGYGTKLHYETIFKFGLSPIHRQSFSIQKQLSLF